MRKKHGGEIEIYRERQEDIYIYIYRVEREISRGREKDREGERGRENKRHKQRYIEGVRERERRERE